MYLHCRVFFADLEEVMTAGALANARLHKTPAHVTRPFPTLLDRVQRKNSCAVFRCFCLRYAPLYERIFLPVGGDCHHSPDPVGTGNECGHLATAFLIGVRVKQVGLKWNKGLFTVRESGTVPQNLAISLAGPA